MSRKSVFDAQARYVVDAELDWAALTFEGTVTRTTTERVDGKPELKIIETKSTMFCLLDSSTTIDTRSHTQVTPVRPAQDTSTHGPGSQPPAPARTIGLPTVALPRPARVSTGRGTGGRRFGVDDQEFLLAGADLIVRESPFGPQSPTTSATRSIRRKKPTLHSLESDVFEGEGLLCPKPSGVTPTQYDAVPPDAKDEGLRALRANVPFLAKAGGETRRNVTFYKIDNAFCYWTAFNDAERVQFHILGVPTRFICICGIIKGQDHDPARLVRRMVPRKLLPSVERWMTDARVQKRPEDYLLRLGDLTLRIGWRMTVSHLIATPAGGFKRKTVEFLGVRLTHRLSQE